MNERKPDHRHEYERAFLEFIQFATRPLTLEEEIKLSQLIKRLRELGAQCA